MKWSLFYATLILGMCIVSTARSVLRIVYMLVEFSQNLCQRAIEGRASTCMCMLSLSPSLSYNTLRLWQT